MISVIIPTYNRRELLVRAVESVLNQTYAELECIVVDDASTDDTQTAMLEIRDERLQYVRLKENGGACAARNYGVDMARGEYIAFQDSDDVWHPDKLEKQLAQLEASGADVVVCAMHRMLPEKKYEVFPGLAVDRPLSRDELLLENLTSSQCIMGRAEVFRDVRFDAELPRLQDWDLMLRITKKYQVHLGCTPLVDVYLQPDSISAHPRRLLTALRRLYARNHQDIVRRDALLVHDERVDMRWIRMMEQTAADCGEEAWTPDMLDAAPDWVLRLEDVNRAERVRILVEGGTLGQRFLPGTLVAYMDIAAFTPGPGVRYLPGPLLPALLRHGRVPISFDGEWRQNGAKYPHLAGAVETLRRRYGCRYVWQLLAEVYGGAELAGELAASQLMQLQAWAGALREIDMPVRGGKVRRIGVYYHSLRNGGVQRTAAALIRLWVQMGYEVTLLTAQEPSEEDYELPQGVMRHVIPAFDHIHPENRRAHVLELVRWAKGVDVLVYHAWADPMILWDLLAVRSMGVRFVVHTHSVFTMPLMEPTMFDRFMALPDVYALADGVVTLSDVDRSYWGQVNARVYATVNPLTYPVEEVPLHKLGSREILWCGRMTQEKRPMDAVAILQEVVKQAPDAHLTLLGETDAPTRAALERMIEAGGLAGKVELAGFCQDPRPYYERADVYLCTSLYEGFCLTIAEAAAFGVPCVTYDMPYLTTLQGGGHIAVPQGDVQAAARALVRVLRDAQLRNDLGQAARLHARTRLNVDQRAIWQRIFDDQTRTLPPMVLTNAQAVMLRTLREHVAMSRQAATAAQGQTYQMAFVPMPEKGPAKKLRKKTATFLQVLMIEGPAGIARIMKEKRERK